MMKRLLLVAMLGCSALWGQTADGLVSGQVREPNGKLVGPLQVYLSGVDPGNRTSMVVRTNDAGFFQFNMVPGFLPDGADAQCALLRARSQGPTERHGPLPP